MGEFEVLGNMVVAGGGFSNRGVVAGMEEEKGSGDSDFDNVIGLYLSGVFGETS